MTTNRDQIREAVTEYYGSKAQRAAGETDIIFLETAGADACCDDNCCAPIALTEEEKGLIKGIYAQDEVAGLPAGAVEAAAGCGNPTAIAEIKPGETVLDLGSGGGIDCFLAAKKTGPTGHVIGVDMTQPMLDLARRNAAELGVSNVEFRSGEIETLPVEDSSVDVIISNCVVNLSTDKEQTLREAFRALRPGGRLRISDMVWQETRPEGADSLEEWAGCIAGASTIKDFLDTLSRVGFAKPRADIEGGYPGYEGLVSALISGEKP